MKYEPQEVRRVPLMSHFTTTEKLAVALLGRGADYKEIARRMHVSHETAKEYLRSAAAKIPGSLPITCKLRFWIRGATLEQLLGGRYIPMSPSKRDMQETKELQGEEETYYPFY